jgi:hypothetical protein
MTQNQTETKTPPTNEELEKLWVELSQRHGLGVNLRFAREILARWGK